MSVFTGPVLEIKIKNIVTNYLKLAKIIAPSKPSAVVKDDAYGIGADIVAKTLYERADCRDFWVAHAVEGTKIYPFVKNSGIYVLQGIGEDSYELFDKYRFIPVISSPEMLDFWLKNKIEGIKPVIHVETGLNRLGFSLSDLEKLSKEDLKEFSIVMSHLACADEKNHFMNARQLENFNYIRKKYFPNLPASLAASDGAFLGKSFCCDMVRLGAAMYGINTAPYRLNQMANIITFKAPVLQIKNLAKGEFVGYSATYRAGLNKKIAIVSAGYGDGLPRSLSNVGKVFFDIDGTMMESRIIGRVSMDNIICDVSEIDKLRVGDYGLFICDNYTLDDIARDAATISYEILSRIGKNPRIDKKFIF